MDLELVLSVRDSRGRWTPPRRRLVRVYPDSGGPGEPYVVTAEGASRPVTDYHPELGDRVVGLDDDPEVIG